MSRLKYIGNGGFVAGVPARDLNTTEVKKYGKAFLLSTGLYQEEVKIRKTRPVVKPKPAEEVNDG